MLQNITLSVEKELIEAARRRAESKDTTLNAEFRRWLQQYVEAPQTLDDLASLMGRVNYARPGKAFTRDERNER